MDETDELRALEAEVAQDPGDGWTWGRLGRAYGDAAHHALAAEVFEQATRLQRRRGQAAPTRDRSTASVACRESNEPARAGA